MPRSLVRRVLRQPALSRLRGVVRTAKAIPVMAPLVKPLAEKPKPMVCMGRCGHCDVHPCQLHATV